MFSYQHGQPDHTASSDGQQHPISLIITVKSSSAHTSLTACHNTTTADVVTIPATLTADIFCVSTQCTTEPH